MTDDIFSKLTEEEKAICGLPTSCTKGAYHDPRDIDTIITSRQSPPCEDQVLTREEFCNKYGFALPNP